MLQALTSPALMAGVVSALILRIAFHWHCHREGLEKHSSFHHCAWVSSACIGVGVAALCGWALYSLGEQPVKADKKGLETFVTGAVPLVALAYFLFQVLAGALFATTSVVLSVGPGPSGQALVRVSVERDGHWLAEIVDLNFELQDLGGAEQTLQVQPPVKLPGPSDRPLRLAAGERCSAQFLVRLPPEQSCVLTVRVRYFGPLWPVVSQSRDRVLLLPPSAELKATA